MYPYQLFLRNDKRSQYDRIALIMIIINLILFVYVTINAEKNSERNPALVGSILCVLSLIRPLVRKYLHRSKQTDFLFQGLFSSAIMWLFLLQWWIAALMVLFVITYLISKRALKVSVDQASISYPSFPPKEIAWDKLNNIVLKDDLLTIDFKNNRIIQQMIDKKLTSLNEADFNEFCREQLKQVKLA